MAMEMPPRMVSAHRLPNMNHPFLRLTLLLWPLALSTAAAQPANSSTSAASPQQLEERFGAGLAAVAREFELPGVTAAYALPDGSIFAFAYGHADKEADLPMTIETRMLAGSVGKMFVAASVVGLANDGKLTLDDPLHQWLGREPWFDDLPNGQQLTIRHLLTHQGGLADHVNDLRFAMRVRKALADGDHDFCLTPTQLVSFVLKREPLFPPGEGYAYTDTGYILLGMVIERAGGASYYDQLQARFLRPLQLHRTEPAVRRDLAKLAAGYLATDNPLGLPTKTIVDGKLLFNPGNEWTGGGLISNPQDLVRWAKLLFEGRALEKPYVEQLVATAPLDQQHPTRYGLGVFVSRSDLGVKYGHGGWFPGYLTLLEYYPQRRVAVALQTNTDAAGSELLTEVNALVQDLLDGVDTTQ